MLRENIFNLLYEANHSQKLLEQECAPCILLLFINRLVILIKNMMYYFLTIMERIRLNLNEKHP